MFGLLDDIAEGTGKIIGTALGIPIATIAITLGVSAKTVKAAIDAGCETVDEIKDFVDDM